ncbi:FemAB family PEP-CTERM system-associated protein [Candidatus Woesearchaeota archaeon]|nr:FemAB family PEP-CTERM system-associated protein [Candidatus Woesearchaeota archaeon]
MGDWDDFVEEHPDSSFFHRIGWKKVIENSYNFKPHYLVVKENNIILGILPLFEIKQPTGKKLLSVPFSTEGGILSRTETAKQQLIEKAKQLTKQNNLDYLELRQEKDIGSDLKTKDYYCHMKLILGSDPKFVWQQMDKKARNAVRKAEKLGLTTDKGLNYLNDFYKIFSRNMRELGTPVDKKQFFEEIIKHFPSNIEIVVAKLKDKVIGAIFLIKHKNTVKSEWASSLRKYFGYNANQLMYWRAIQDACKDGFEIFDFGRSIEGEGTYNFKKKFGAKSVKLNYKYFINKGDMPDTRKTSKKRQLFAKTWSKLPLFITNNLGPRIREQFP